MMEVYVLDTTFRVIDVVDSYKSFIWTDRYNKCGDFEIYISMNSPSISSLLQDNYLYFKGSEHMMIIDEIKFESDVDDGAYVSVSGHSLEYILNRRVVWKQRDLNGNVQTIIQTLLNEAIINPEIVNRKISNFIFQPSTDTNITGLTVTIKQFTGDNLYDIITKMCESHNIGFKIILNNDNQFVFSLYNGTDRSYNQETVPYIIFSPNFDNIINSTFLESTKLYCNSSLVGGDGEGTNRKYLEISYEDAVGLNRRELFVNAADISSKDENDVDIPLENYNSLLYTRGLEKLNENQIVRVFDGKTEDNIIFKYGTDFFMGDIVQLENEYGIQATVRITEYIMSNGTDGTEAYPTFTQI